MNCPVCTTFMIYTTPQAGFVIHDCALCNHRWEEEE